jgi:hypothetical protein
MAIDDAGDAVALAGAMPVPRRLERHSIMDGALLARRQSRIGNAIVAELSVPQDLIIKIS